MSLTLEMPKGFEDAIKKVVKEAYVAAVEQSRKDYSYNTEYMTKQAVMDALDISNNTLMDNYVSKGLPTYKIGNRIYFRRAEINDFINSHKIN